MAFLHFMDDFLKWVLVARALYPMMPNFYVETFNNIAQPPAVVDAEKFRFPPPPHLGLPLPIFLSPLYFPFFFSYSLSEL